MVVVNKDKNLIVNINSVDGIGINDNNTEITAFGLRAAYRLAKYEDEEVTKTVFNELIEAIENCEEIFYMPE